MRCRPDGADWRGRLAVRHCTSLKNLDDDHAAAAAWTPWLAAVDDGLGRFILTIADGEQFARACDIVGADAPCEQAVMADAVKAFWQHVGEGAAGEIVCGGGHPLFPGAGFDPVIPPSVGENVLGEGDQGA